MKPQDVAKFYAIALSYDSRLAPLTLESTKVWAEHLKTVPFTDALTIMKRIYERPVLIHLQPGHVSEVWEEIKTERKAIIEKIHGIDRYLAATQETDPGVLEEKLEARERYLTQLPDHVIEFAGIRQQQLNPPPKYPRAAALTTTDYAAALKRPA